MMTNHASGISHWPVNGTWYFFFQDIIYLFAELHYLLQGKTTPDHVLYQYFEPSFYPIVWAASADQSLDRPCKESCQHFSYFDTQKTGFAITRLKS